jgi:BlaI family penicillinase repressor
VSTFSKRERQIMDVLYAIGASDVEEVRGRIKDPPGYDSIRTTLRILESKGHVRRNLSGRKHVYKPVQEPASALKSAWRDLVQTFFHGSYEQAAATLLTASDRGLSEKKLAALLEEVKESRQRRGK